MRPTLLALATTLVRVWTRVYTWGLEPRARDARRAEIDSDLWEQVHAPAAGSLLPLQIVGRLLLGMPHDLQWRLEGAWPIGAASRQILLVAIASVLVFGTLWAVSASRLPEQPAIYRPAPEKRMDVARYPPPPPPPPLCAPGAPPQANCTRWP
jgi:hypothetical protein